jgi:hypothetical protein
VQLTRTGILDRIAYHDSPSSQSFQAGRVEYHDWQKVEGPQDKHILEIGHSEACQRLTRTEQFPLKLLRLLCSFITIHDSAFALERHHFALQSYSLFTYVIVRDIRSSSLERPPSHRSSRFFWHPSPFALFFLCRRRWRKAVPSFRNGLSAHWQFSLLAPLHNDPRSPNWSTRLWMNEI